jgi:hypothetical protein
MATREQNCRFGVDEQGEKPCGECRRCCDELKARLRIWEGGVRADALKALNERPELLAKLHTLEAAVRAVRNGDRRGVAMNFHTLDKLYALVPEVGA